PTLILPNDFTVEATSSAGAAVTFTVTSDGSVACSPASGSTFPVATTTVQCTATGVGGTTSGSFKVTVVDTKPPVITVPGTLTAEATSAAGAVVVYTASAADKVDGNVAVSCAPPAASTFPLGTTAVQCTATDSHGNTGTNSFTVIVQDTTSPSIPKIEVSPTVLWPPDHTMRIVTLTVTAKDAVSTPVSKIILITSNQPINGPGDGNTTLDYLITGPLTVQLRAERSQGKDRTYTITVEAVDAAGNRSVGTTQVVVTNSRPRAVR
ncbi:MAG TPA: HYR domain-containing protein, partial [Thermoanaerobaculia bacterium]|nr:HYR domain-containing protein [Thermoanaerobaculia bacterium]